MDKEFYYDSMEEAFAEANFEYGEEKEVIEANLAKAKNIYAEESENVSQFCDKLEDGEVFDECGALFSLQRMILADRFVQTYQDQLNCAN